MTQITDIFHNGQNWVANILVDDIPVELDLTDAQKNTLVKAGVKIYEG